MANSRILFMCDNMSIVAVLNSHTAKEPQIMQLLRRLVVSTMTHNIHFASKHIPGKINSAADALSRVQNDAALQLAPWLNAEPDRLPKWMLPWGRVLRPIFWLHLHRARALSMREPSSACSSLHYRYHTTVRGSLAPSHLFVCSLRTCSILLWPGRHSQPIYLAFHFFINCSDILTLLTIFLSNVLCLEPKRSAHPTMIDYLSLFPCYTDCMTLFPISPVVPIRLPWCGQCFLRCFTPFCV